MSRAHGIISKGTTEKYADAVSKLRSPGDYILVVRGIPRTIVMSCPDGCGETLTVNLDRRTGPAWRKYERKGKLTIYPSVWREAGCRAHFIVWNDRILWCESADSFRVTVDEALINDVFGNLSIENFIHFELIAELLQAIPWEILWACKELARRGQALEGNKGTFRRVGNRDIPPPDNGRINILA